MITIKYSRDKPQRVLTMTVNGHAGYAPAGHDVICGAVTILARTLVKVVCDMHEAHALARPPTVWTESGNVEASCKMCDSLGYSKALVAYDTIFEGMKLLAMAYPDYVEIIGEKHE